MLRKKSISALMLLIGLLQGVWPVICHLFTDILFQIHGEGNQRASSSCLLLLLPASEAHFQVRWRKSTDGELVSLGVR